MLICLLSFALLHLARLYRLSADAVQHVAQRGGRVPILLGEKWPFDKGYRPLKGLNYP